MKKLKNIKDIVKSGLNTICSILPYEGIRRPVFIIGCGRSGTTILGTALSKNRQISYLNEPRDLWITAFPETDIWSSKAADRNGKLTLSEADAHLGNSKKIRRLFRFETIKSGKPVLVEKLPINNFRLKFIHKIFPDARFIHIYRNGLEVARSIEKMNENTDWFGEKSYKWSKLVEHALIENDTKSLPELCSCAFDKGLLEWRLSTEAAVSFLGNLSRQSFLEIHYDDFVRSPVDTISQVLNFIGLEKDPEVESFVSKNIVRRTSKLGADSVTEKELLLGGPLLQLAMNAKQDLTGQYSKILRDGGGSIVNQ